MIAQIALFLLVNLVMFVGGQLLSIRVNSNKSISYRFLMGITYYVFQIQLSILTLGLVGELYKNTLYGLNLVISIALTAGSARTVSLNNFSILKSSFLKLRKIGLGFIPLVLFGIFSLLALIRIVIFPPHVWDVLTYHLLAPINWFQSGSISMLNTPVDRANFNFLGTKTYNLWTLFATDSLMLVELTSFAFTILLLFTIFAILRKLEVNYFLSSTFSVLAVSIPTILIQMRTTHDHTPILAATFLLIYLLLESLKRHRLDHSHVVNIVMVSALMVGLKVHGIIYLFLLYALFGILSWRHKHNTVFMSPNLKSILAISITLAFSLFVGSFWGIRNYYEYNNVFGPKYTHDALEKNVGPNKLVSASLSLSSNLLRNISHAPTRILDFDEPYSVDSTRISSYGLPFFTFGLLGYFLAGFLILTTGRLSIHSDINKSLLFLTSFSILTQLILYSLYFTYFNYRILTIFPIVGILLAGYAFSKLDLNPQQRLGLCALVASLLFFTYFVIPTTDKTTPTRARFVTERQGVHSISDFSAILNDEWALISLIPTTATIAYHTHEDGFVLPYYDKNLNREVMSLDKIDFQIENQVLTFTERGYRDLNRLGVDYIHVNNEYSAPKHNYMWVDTINSERVELIMGGLYKVKTNE